MERIVQFFSSVRLTNVLFILIVALAVLGTLIPQQDGAALPTDHFSPEILQWLIRLQIFDLYHSAFFHVLMVLLSLNLIVCSVSRFPVAWKKIHATPFPAPGGFFDDVAIRQTIRTQDRALAAHATVVLLERRFGHVARNESDHAIVFFGQRGRWGHLGVYVVHASVLLIIAGAVIGSIWGFEGYVSIVEGQSVQHVDARRGSDRTLDFAVRCDRFVVDYYAGGVPKTYRSDLSFLRGGRIVQRDSVLVNHPVTFDGLRFYQSNFDVMPGGKALLSYTAGAGMSREVTVAEGAAFELPEKNVRVAVLRFDPDLMEMGPAVKLRIVSPQGDTQLWVFQHIDKILQKNPGLLSWMPGLDPAGFKPYVFKLRRIQSPYVTGLQVMSDPGAPFVAAGAVLMICGLLISFWMPHRRLWVRIDEVDGTSRIVLAGISSRNPVRWAGEIQHLTDALREAINTCQTR